MNVTLLIGLLVLLCLWLAYRLLKSRLELINIQATDFHALADNAHDGIFIVQNKKLVYANQRAGEILGYSNDELLKLKLVDIVHPDEAEQVLDIHLRRLRGEDVPKQYEAIFLNQHGGSVPVELTAAITTWHSSPAGLVIIRDITDRKLIAQTLVDSEKRYRSLVENSPDAIIIIDAESNSIIEANEQTSELLKYPRQKLFELNISELSADKLLKHNRKPLSHYIERALHGVPLLFEHSFVTSENRPLSCEVRLSRMPFPKRRLLRASITDISERKLYQAAIMQSEQRLFNFFEATYEILFFHDNGIIRDVNNQVEKLFGRTREEVIGKNVLEFVAPESRDTAQRYMQQGKQGPYELIALHKDGRRFPVQINTRDFHENSNQRIVSVVDISQLKETHSALMASKQKLQNILDNLMDTYYQTDENGRLIMISASGEQLLGYKPDEAIGIRLTNLYADSFERQFFLDTLKNKNGEVHNYQAAMRHKDGSIRWVSTNARFIYDKENQVCGVEGIARDITQQREYELALSRSKKELELEVERRTQQLETKISELEKVQQQLSHSEQNFRTLVDNAVDSIFLHDLKGRIIDLNQQACKSLGYSREELLQLNINDIDIGPAPITFKNIAGKLQNRESYQVESILLCKDGSQFPVEINLGLLKQGHSSLILALVRDITHRSKAIRPAKPELENADS